MFEEIIKSLASELDRRKIPYMLIGGQAVLLYGEPRLTRDIDITLGMEPEQYQQIIELSKNLELKILVPEPEKFVNQTMVLPCQEPTSGIRIDFIFSFSAYEQEALKRVRNEVIGGIVVRYASLEDLLIHKIVAGRARDIEDVKSILNKNPKNDGRYIERWLKEFSELLSRDLLKTYYDCKRNSGMTET